MYCNYRYLPPVCKILTQFRITWLPGIGVETHRLTDRRQTHTVKCPPTPTHSRRYHPSHNTTAPRTHTDGNEHRGSITPSATVLLTRPASGKGELLSVHSLCRRSVARPMDVRANADESKNKS